MIMFCAFYNYISLFLPAQIYKSSCILCTLLRTRLISPNRVHILILIYTYIIYITSEPRGITPTTLKWPDSCSHYISIYKKSFRYLSFVLNIGKLECHYLHIKQPSFYFCFCSIGVWPGMNLWLTYKHDMWPQMTLGLPDAPLSQDIECIWVIRLICICGGDQNEFNE